MSNSGNKLSPRIYRVNKLFRLKIQDTLRPYSITTDQWIILDRIYNYSGIYNQREIAAQCFKEKAAVTRTLDIMEKKGLLQRRDSEDDRRVYKIFITDYGREIFEKSLPLIKKMEEDVDEALTKDEQKKAIELLDKLEKSLRRE